MASASLLDSLGGGGERAGSIGMPDFADITGPPTLEDRLLSESSKDDGTPEWREWVARALARRRHLVPT